MRPSELADLDSTRTGSSREDFSWEGRGSRQPIEAARSPAYLDCPGSSHTTA